MPKICVEIELDTDTGKVMVGVEPPEAAEDQGAAAQQPQPGGQPIAAAGGDVGAEGAEDKSYLQPAPSVDAALQVARDLLSGQSGAQAQDAESQMAQGFAKGGGAMGQPKPAMA